ncbi:MAG: YlbF family regulator [Gemmatimonadetes bacterium]|nr:YlbF family regulator [Gemmatimonadota bacterium]
MADILDMAAELGRAMGRTAEYRALKEAMAAADDDRELVELRNRLTRIEEQMEGVLRRGEEPGEALVAEYEEVFSRLQANATYQRLVAGQANFDRVLARVNEQMTRGMQDAEQGRIVLLP